MSDSKILIAYFSRKGKNYYGGSIVDLSVGNTEVAARMIEKITGGEMFKIEPVNEYSADYQTCTEEAKAELDKKARPELANYNKSIEDYDVIILGYPNWWSTMPMPVFTFLERYDFSGKTILPFCTHEGSGMGRSEKDIQSVCSRATILKGLPIQGSYVKSAENVITEWLKNTIHIAKD